MSRYLKLFAVLVVLVLLRSNVSAAASPATGLITFTSYRDGNREVYIMNADGTAQTRLTYNLADDFGSCLSPDGSKIVFISDRESLGGLYIMNSDGTGLSRLLSGGSARDCLAPSFSPDGSQIVFWRSPGAPHPEIHVINSDGTGLRKLTENIDLGQAGGYFNYRPVFSPDGSKIVFTSSRSGQDHVYVIDADGSELTRLTSSYGGYAPAWSPNGSKIVYESNREGRSQIYMMNADGSGDHRVSDLRYYDRNPVFSSNGTRIAFSSMRGGWYHLFDMATDGTDQQTLTTDADPLSFQSQDDQFPAWGTGGIPVPTISVGDVSVIENNTDSSDVVIPITLSSASSRAVRVRFTITENSAQAWDFTSSTGAGTLVFAPGETIKTIPITVRGDFVDELDETLFLDLSEPIEARIEKSRGVVTIVDDDSAGIRVTPVSNLTTTEAAGQAIFDVTLNSSSDNNVRVTLNSSNIHEGTVSSTPLIFNWSNWNVPQRVVVTGTDDGIVDGEQVYNIVLTSSSDDALYSNIALNVPLSNLDNDHPTLTLNLLQSTILEGRSVNAVLTRNTSTAKSLVVSLVSSDTTELRVPHSVIIPAGQNQVSIAIGSVADSVVDGTKTTRLLASTRDHARAEATLTVTDRDRPHITGFLTPSLKIKEGPAGKPGTFANLTIQTNVENRTQSQVFRLSVTPPNQVRIPSTVIMPAGANRVTVRVAAIDDDIQEGAQELNLRVAAAGHRIFGIPFYLNDNDASYRIRGRVTVDPNNTVGSAMLPATGVAIYLKSGSRTLDMTFADSAGYYQFDNLLKGQYALVPRSLRASISPQTRQINLSSVLDVVGQNFTSTYPTSIYGTISSRRSDGSLAGLPGILVQTKSALRAYSVRTSANGAYRFEGLPLGVYTVQPIQTGKVFSPRSALLKLSTSTPESGEYNFTLLDNGNVTATAPDATGNGVVTALPRSSVVLSSATAAQGVIKLNFSNLLNQDSALDATLYQVTINGVLVPVESVAVNGASVVLGLAEDAFKAGDTLAVAWSGLRDRQGRPLQGQQVSQAR